MPSIQETSETNSITLGYYNFLCGSLPFTFESDVLKISFKNITKKFAHKMIKQFSFQNEDKDDSQQSNRTNVSKCDDVFIEINTAHLPDTASASSKEPNCLECEPPTKAQLTESNNNTAADADNNINTAIIIDTDCISTPDIDALIDDGKIQEFINYIEKIDENLTTPDKLQFQEFQEKPKRLRYPSYNYGEKDDDDFTVTLVDDPMEIEKQADERENHLKNLAMETDKLNSMLNPYTKSYERTRKMNLYSRDINQFLDNEQLDTSVRINVPNAQQHVTPLVNNRIEETQNLKSNSQSSNEDDKPKTDNAVIKSEKIGLSHSFPVFRSKRDETPATVDSTISDDRDRSLSIGLSLETVNRQESETSMLSSDSSDVKFYHPDNISRIPSSIYAHEGSSISTDSNVIFMRSQSDISDLEYIKTRQDWKDRQNSIDIREEIDSDDYHHDRRHSEAVEMLEYIRGREDWLETENQRARDHHHNRLSRIYEHADYRILIREEINSDEYHHNRQINEAIQHALHLHPKFLVQGSARSGRERSPYKVLRADIDKSAFLERYYWKDGNHREMDELEGARSIPDTYYSQIDISEKSMIDKEHLIWITNDNGKSRSQSPYAVQITIEENDKIQSVQAEGRSSEITEIIETLIETDLIGPDSSGGLSQQDESRLSTPVDSFRRTPKKSYSEPFIVISEATDDEQELVTDDEDGQSKENVIVSSPEDEIDISGNFEIINMDDQEVQATAKDDDKTETSPTIEEIPGNDVNEAQSATVAETQDLNDSREDVVTANGGSVDITEETSIKESTAQNTIDNEVENASQTVKDIESTNITTELIDTKEAVGASTKTLRKPRKSLKNDNLEDLIQEGSLGIWFHK